MKIEFSQYFNLSMPIIQAPMAGADNNDLVIKVTKAGGLGSRGMGYNSAEQIIATLEDLKRNNISYYNINLFVPKLLDVDIHSNEFKRKVNQLEHYLSPICSALDVDLNDAVIFDPKQRFDEQLDVVFSENIPILSTTFGTLSPEIITACHKKNIYFIGTATTVEEAKLHEALGYDAVVLQGTEAGGHRGGFNERSLAGQMPLMTLVDSVLNQIDIPIIAAWCGQSENTLTKVTIHELFYL